MKAVVLSEELATVLEGARRSTVMLDMPPLLGVAVVSPKQEKRDYRYKRSEYAARGIADYWIVDSMQQRVTVLEWVKGLYEERVFEGEGEILSPLFGKSAVGWAKGSPVPIDQYASPSKMATLHFPSYFSWRLCLLKLNRLVQIR